MVSNDKGASRNLQGTGLKVKEGDRARKSRSFMSRFGIGGLSQDEKFNSTLSSNILFSHNQNGDTSKQNRPTTSSPRLMGVFGHSHSVDAPGQHPSNYPFGAINALQLAGIPLPGSDSIRKSFDIPSPNEGSMRVVGVPKILLNLSDMSTSFDQNYEASINSNEKKIFPMHDVKADGRSNEEKISENDPVKNQLQKLHTSMPDKIASPSKAPAMIVRRPTHRQAAIRRQSFNRFSSSTGTSVSSSEFSLSVALMPPDCETESQTGEAFLENRESDLVSAYAVAHAHATALGSPLTIHTTSLMTKASRVRQINPISSAASKAFPRAELEDDLKEEKSRYMSRNGLGSHPVLPGLLDAIGLANNIFQENGIKTDNYQSKPDTNELLGDELDSNLSQALLHTPAHRLTMGHDRKRHNSMSEEKNNVPLQEGDLQSHSESYETECDDDHLINAGQIVKVQTPPCMTPETRSSHADANANGFETEKRSTHTIDNNKNNGNEKGNLHSKKKRIKSVAAVAVAAAAALKESKAHENGQAPSTPRSANCQFNKRFQGSPPPHYEGMNNDRDSGKQSMPRTPFRYLTQVNRNHDQLEQARTLTNRAVTLHHVEMYQKQAITLAHRNNVGSKQECSNEKIKGGKSDVIRQEDLIPNCKKDCYQDDLRNKHNKQIKLSNGEKKIPGPVTTVHESRQLRPMEQGETKMKHSGLVAELQIRKFEENDMKAGTLAGNTSNLYAEGSFPSDASSLGAEPVVPKKADNFLMRPDAGICASTHASAARPLEHNNHVPDSYVILPRPPFEKKSKAVKQQTRDEKFDRKEAHFEAEQKSDDISHVLDVDEIHAKHLEDPKGDLSALSQEERKCRIGLQDGIEWLVVNNKQDLKDQKSREMQKSSDWIDQLRERRKSMIHSNASRSAEENEKRRSVYAAFRPKLVPFDTASTINFSMDKNFSVDGVCESNLEQSATSVKQVSISPALRQVNKQSVTSPSHNPENKRNSDDPKGRKCCNAFDCWQSNALRNSNRGFAYCIEGPNEHFDSGQIGCHGKLSIEGTKAEKGTDSGFPKINCKYHSREQHALLIPIQMKDACTTGHVPTEKEGELQGQEYGKKEECCADLKVKQLFVCSVENKSWKKKPCVRAGVEMNGILPNSRSSSPVTAYRNIEYAETFDGIESLLPFSNKAYAHCNDPDSTLTTHEGTSANALKGGLGRNHEIKAQKEFYTEAKDSSPEFMFANREAIQQWAYSFDNEALKKNATKLKRLSAENICCRFDKDSYGRRTMKFSEHTRGISTEASSVHRCKDCTIKEPLIRSKFGPDELHCKMKGIYKNQFDLQDQYGESSFPIERPFNLTTPSRPRSQSLTSLTQTAFKSIVSTSSSTVSLTKVHSPFFSANRQSVSSIAPTLVTALASLPSDRSIDHSYNNLIIPTDNLHIPGSFDEIHYAEMPSTVRRSRSLHSLLRKKEKKDTSSAIMSPESSAPASEAFKSAYGDEVQRQQAQSSSSSAASITYEDDASVEDNTVSPRWSMMQTQKAQLRASHLIENSTVSPKVAQKALSHDEESLFDSLDNENEEEKQFRESHSVHRRCSSDITSDIALMKGLGLQKKQQPPRPQRMMRMSSNTSKTSDTFLSNMGCWMEEAEEERPQDGADRETIVDEIANAASGERTRKSRPNAPPVPPRRRADARRVQDDASVPAASASAGSWSRVRKVPMYIRLGHLPTRLVDAPSTMSWRSRIGSEYEELSQKFDQREMHRQEVIEELYVTEHNFIVQITSILRTFSEPVRFSDHAFHDSVPLEVARLFHDLDTILAVHVKMFTALDANIKAHPSSLVVSLAETMRPTIEGLTAYQSYLNRYKSVIRLLDSLNLSNEKGSLAWFAETMDRQAGLSECKGMGFGSFLLKPVQRLMKYPLFFKQLDELMDESHPDKQATTSLYRATERLIGNLNAVKAREEDFEMLLALEQRISGLPEGTFLASRERKLIKQGPIQCVRLTEMERLTLSERARWESPNLTFQSPLLGGSDSLANPSLRRLSLVGSSPSSTPRSLEPESGLESGSASGCSTSSTTASTPSAGSNLTISSTFTSPALSSTYFDFKSADESNIRETGDQNVNSASKRKSVAGFLLRGNNAGQVSPVNLSFEGNNGKSPIRSESKEEDDLYVFIFDDLCLVTKRDQRPLKSKKKNAAVKNASALKEDLDTYSALEYVGMSRILGVQQWKNALIGHEDLLEVELMPIKPEPGFGNLKNSLSSTITFHFSFDSAKEQSSSWNQAFERSFCASIQTRRERAAKGEMVKKLSSQSEWRRREKHITEVVNNAALAADRVNLAALLQAGLPFPRSPAQQNLADMAFRTAAKAESCGLESSGKGKDSPVDRQRSTSNSQSPLATNTPSRPSTSRLRSTSSNPSLRQGTAAVRQLDAETVPRIGDMNAMYGGSGTGTVTSWEEDRQEERKWWRMRFHEVEKENERQEEVEKMVEMRRSRVSMPSPSLSLMNANCLESTGIPMMRSFTMNSSHTTVPAAASMNADDFAKSKSQVELVHTSSLRLASTPSPARTVRTNKVRKGLPILKISSANESSSIRV